MPTFSIDTENNITAFTAAEQLPEGHDRFASEKEFAKLSTGWPITRFVEVWNGFAGVVPFDTLKPVKKFTDRKTAVARIWKAVQALTPAAAPQGAQDAPKAAKPRKGRTQEKDSAPARQVSKKAIVLDMLKRPDGATLQEIMSVTGWMAHSVRGFISGGLGKKMGLNVESFKTTEGVRGYRIAAK
jgi:hypothetical protein